MSEERMGMGKGRNPRDVDIIDAAVLAELEHLARVVALDQPLDPSAPGPPQRSQQSSVTATHIRCVRKPACPHDSTAQHAENSAWLDVQREKSTSRGAPGKLTCAGCHRDSPPDGRRQFVEATSTLPDLSAVRLHPAGMP